MARESWVSTSDRTEILRHYFQVLLWVSQVVLEVKNSPANAGDVRDAGSIPGSGRSPGEGNGTLAWKIPRTEEPDRLQSMGSQRVGHD